MHENADTGHTTIIVRIQNNTERDWSEVEWEDAWDGNSYDINGRLPTFKKGGFIVHSGSEHQILVEASPVDKIDTLIFNIFSIFFI